MNSASQGLAGTNYRVRTPAFLYCGLVVGVILWERGAGPLAWALLLLQFAVYPHLVYWRARFSPRPTRAELDNLFLDAALFGAWCAALGFPTWLTYGLISGASLNAVVNRGAKGLVLSLAYSGVGALVWTLARSVPYAPATSELVTALCIVGVFLYMSVVGYVVHATNRRLAATRDALRLSEERYKLIAENAGDLIAMVDQQGRWVYTSPAYERVLDAADLAVGGDSFAKLHPDDADKARVALARAWAGHKPRDIAVRLVDREGRVRQYKTRVQPLAGDGAPRLLLVSQDVTDLRESEERVLLAAHAFEGMTEGIVITSADGTIVTVNRAFCELTGFTRDEVLGQSERVIRNALQPPEFYDEVYKKVAREGYWSGTIWAQRKNGSVYKEWRSVRIVRDASGVVTHYVFVFYEVGAPQRPGIDITNPNVRG
jgi:PAS domain S-box-containing protein